ncbi:phosphotransferase [Bacillus pseudomycoides]|uniref:phosphotransferase n=1 Tax=Bacillus pseudomycoides TaxID=64104 RepID=UPI000BEE5E91|nr:phosphotransferase [Bacillus pseudomycoides]PEF72853.1 nitrate reductase [Bacillus pseudomycoides]PEI42945.1 nitrate reductase [Bacillus pseudomycoides]PEJ29807.1 nitrate reductase [Bacillus pseudomycoides]PEL77871.1 nitrate reductase [Bacillus pseudomycoides]PEM28278.1 nitrate reductase [Bacillus pseudomycoides]
MLQGLFTSPILSIDTLHPGYEDHASDVWLVKTKTDEVIVRSSKMKTEPNNDFWWGCKHLFGIDPRNVHMLETIHKQLQQYTTLPIPKILQKHTLEREYVIVEKLNGQVLKSFIEQPNSILYNLGKGLAQIHQYKANYIGNPSGTFQIPLHKFQKHITNVSKQLVEMFHSNNSKINDLFVVFQSQLQALPVPQEATLVLIDMDPTQFLTDGVVITGLVDTEAYAVAPRELDFIGLEYVFTEKEAHAFRQGYETIMPLPNLEQCRAPYRYLYRLLSVQGNVGLEEWLQHPVFF